MGAITVSKTKMLAVPKLQPVRSMQNLREKCAICLSAGAKNPTFGVGTHHAIMGK